jgi:hypothetical protein
MYPSQKSAHLFDSFFRESLPLSWKINKSAKRCDKTIRTSYSCLLVILLGGDCEVHC